MRRRAITANAAPSIRHGSTPGERSAKTSSESYSAPPTAPKHAYAGQRREALSHRAQPEPHRVSSWLIDKDDHSREVEGDVEDLGGRSRAALSQRPGRGRNDGTRRAAPSRRAWNRLDGPGGTVLFRDRRRCTSAMPRQPSSACPTIRRARCPTWRPSPLGERRRDPGRVAIGIGLWDSRASYRGPASPDSRTVLTEARKLDQGAAMTALTSWVLDHRRLVVGVWVAVTVGAFAALGPAGRLLVAAVQAFPDGRASRRTRSSVRSTAPAATSRRSCPWSHSRKGRRLTRPAFARSLMRRWRRWRRRCRSR